MKLMQAAVAATTLTLAAASAQAGLIGQTINHQCPECGPPYSADFVAVVGGPELTPFDQWAVDVEDNSILITLLFDSDSIIDPGHFSFSWDSSAYTLLSASLDASSTLSYGLVFDAGSVTLDFGGIPVDTGDFVLVNLTPVPEPTSLALMALGLAGLGLRARARRA